MDAIPYYLDCRFYTQWPRLYRCMAGHLPGNFPGWFVDFRVACKPATYPPEALSNRSPRLVLEDHSPARRILQRLAIGWAWLFSSRCCPQGQKDKVLCAQAG